MFSESKLRGPFLLHNDSIYTKVSFIRFVQMICIYIIGPGDG